MWLWQAAIAVIGCGDRLGFSRMLDWLLLVAWCFVTAWIGGFAGLVLGNLRLVAVLALAPTAAVATGTNIGISAVAAGTASVSHVRGGRVHWRLFAWMMPPSIAGAVAGGYLSGVMPQRVLLMSIAAVVLYSGIDLWRWQRPAESQGDPADGKLNIPIAVVTGAVIGLLGGIVGLLLGSLRIPALIRYVGEAPTKAVGTNVTIGLCVGVAGVIGHLPSAPPDWRLLAAGALGSIPGAALGARLTGRLSERQLMRGIAIVLLVAGVATGVSAFV